jgi:hypothetical protein
LSLPENASAIAISMPPVARRWPRLALAAAAALVLVALAAMLWPRGRKLEPADVITRTSPTPVATPDVNAPPAPTIEPRMAKQPALQTPRRSRPPIRPIQVEAPMANQSEVATGYIPLTYSTDKNAAKDGLVVRVEIARSSLIAMGLPLNIERANERVKADVVLGVDGVPLAIRLVQ